MDIIEIAKECCEYLADTGDFTLMESGEMLFSNAGLQQFVQRIEAPHKQRIAELEQLLAIENERAAVICTSLAPSKREFSPRFYDACYVCADAIRAAKYDETSKALEGK